MFFVIVTAGIFGLDFFLKHYIDKKYKLAEETHIMKGKIILQKYYNKGVALDRLEKYPGLVKIFSGSILLVLLGIFLLSLRKKGGELSKLGMAMVLGGGMNNFFDRLTKGHVVDYFSFKSRIDRIQKIIFNLSDIFIIIGTAIMFLFKKK